MSSVAGAAPHGPPEDLLLETVDHLPLAIAVLTADGAIVHANGSFGDLVRRAPGRLEGTRLHEVVTDEATKVDEMLRRWSASTGMRPGVLLIDDGAEDAEPLELRCDGARLRSHPLTLLIARERERVVRPFSELTSEIETRNLREMRARLEASVDELRVANRRLLRSNEELETYAQVVSHDLRTPIATITGFVDLLLDDITDGVDQDSVEMLATIQRAARRMDEVTMALLRLSRVGGGGEPDVQRVDPNEILDEVTEQLGDGFAAADGTIRADDLHAVRVEPAHLVQILQNLVGNSVKFREPDRPLDIAVSSEQDGGWIRFTVRDNGVGIPEHEREDIFEILGRGSRVAEIPGSGIGLSTCRKIIELYGGEIACPPSDDGATFTFTLPASGQ